MRIFFLLLINSIFLFGQNFYTWKNYTDKRNLTDIEITDNGAWAATAGGVFYFDFADSSYVSYTKSEGLHSQNITAIATDKNGNIWIGTAEGYINILNISTDEVKTIIDIATSDKTNKRINNLEIKGDTVFVSTDFGLSMINSKDFHFFDTITKFGDFPTEIKVNSLSFNNALTVSTVKGVAFLKKGVKNLSAPESWQTYAFNSDFFAKNVYKTLYFKGYYVAATDTGLFEFKNNKWKRILYANYHVNDIFISDDTLYSTVGSKLFKYDGDVSTEVKNFKNAVPKRVIKKDGVFYVATNRGMFIFDYGKSENIYPNGPVQNSMHKLAVDYSGRLWTVSGKSPKGSGINMFDGNTWQNFNKDNVAAISLNAFYSVFPAKDGRVFFANWGDGFTVFQGDSFFTYNAANTTLTGIANAPSFIPITDIALDSEGNIWVLNLSNLNSEPISVLTTDNKWFHYKFGYPLLPSSAGVYSLVIDQYDTKWFTVKFDGEPGLYYFNENKTFDNTDDDIWGILKSSNGLNSDNINAIALDKAGELWIGTALGVNFLANPANPNGRIGSVFSLRQQNITCITVDPLNRKWVGTNQGVFLISPDGSTLIKNYTVDNSPLASNNINSIAFDDKDGVVYIATDFCISSLRTMGLKPNKDFKNIFVYPNPFYLNGKSNGKVYIDGLIRNSFVKIMTASGQLVKEYLSTPGGRIAVWDGKDSNGNFVSSGIYIIALYDEEANNIAVTKIAVIRK